MPRRIRAVHRRRLVTSMLTLGLAVTGAGAALAAAAPTGHPSPDRSPRVDPRALAKHHPMFMPTVANQWATPGSQHAALAPPAPPCPESGKLPSPFSNCGLPEFPAAGEPYPGNMTYWGGHVQVNPKVYLVLWGWGRPDAFKHPCHRVPLVEGRVRATLKCDPDGAGKRMADFIYQMGGTGWAGVQTQFYEKVGSREVHIKNPKNQLGGIWIDDSSQLDPNKSHIYKDPILGSQQDAGGVYRQFAVEAERAMRHFHVTDLKNSQFIIAQPENYSDPYGAGGYCAWHDYTQPVLENGWYDHITPGISFTNMPYVLSNGTGCGENAVNAGAAGTLDGVTITLGHEIEETVTDPGAEDIKPDGTVLGGWFDPFDANENGDKCAWVGTTVHDAAIPAQPGQPANIRGNHGGSFAVQSLWSNIAAEGVGYCAGAGNDLPVPNGS